MQIQNHDIESLKMTSELSSYFANKIGVPQDILIKAIATAKEEGYEDYKASHLVKAGLPVNKLPRAGFRPTILLNFQPKEYYKFWDINSVSVGFSYRYSFIKNNGFPIITKENLDTLVKITTSRKVLDVGAGSCILGEELKKHKINIKTLDIMSYKDKVDAGENGYRFITKYDPDIINNIENHDISDYNTFLISWCDYEGGASTSVLRRMKRGDILILNGESQGGCTGSYRFFELLSNMQQKNKIVIDDDATDELNENSFRFYGIHDYFNVYTRK